MFRLVWLTVHHSLYTHIMSRSKTYLARVKVSAEILAKYLPMARSHHLVKKRSTHSRLSRQRRSNSKKFADEFQTTHHQAISHTIQSAWKPSTSKRYSSNLRQFLQFCEDQGVPAHLRLPASEFLLCSFASGFAGLISGSTARSKIAAIRAWHIRNGLLWLGGQQLSYVLRGVDRLTPGSSRQPQRPPITVKMLLDLHDGLNRENNLDVAVYATACLAFWGQMRLGELLPSSALRFDPDLVPSVLHLGIPNDNGSRTLFLPNTKCGNSRGEAIIVCRQVGIEDPISALDQHLSLNAGSGSDPLCSYLSSDGSRIVLTKARFLKRCNSIWSRLGYARFTGHAFRIGGTTHLLLAGLPPDVIKALGRWSSDAFLRYWRSLDKLGPLYLECLEGVPSGKGIGSSCAHDAYRGSCRSRSVDALVA